MASEMTKILEACEYIREKSRLEPRFGIILGSGLGAFGEELEGAVALNFSTIPHFPESTVEGHRGRLLIGTLNNIPLMVLQGRFHYYEGYTMQQVVFPLRCMLHLGISNLVVTNAAGSVDRDYRPGELMLIKDHIKLHGDSPLRGANMENFGPRFNDMSDPYSQDIRELARECGRELAIELREGVYFFMPGPSYETASEVRAINILGANVVGMSTVPEVIVAAHGGMQILGISCITNMGTGIQQQPVDHQDVIRAGDLVAEKFIRLLQSVILKWNEL